jgi:hypothetical protein
MDLWLSAELIRWEPGLRTGYGGPNLSLLGTKVQYLAGYQCSGTAGCCELARLRACKPDEGATQPLRFPREDFEPTALTAVFRRSVRLSSRCCYR